ncbi:MAG TPA: hypothetical protein VF407_24040 [Polyangiaceae bacterium]
MKRVLLLLSALSLLPLASACDDQETTAIVDNGYPTLDDGGLDPQKSITVYRAWWLVSVFADPVAAGASSSANRVVPGQDTAYFLLAPGWDPASSDPPTNLVVAKSNDVLKIDKDNALHIAVDDDHVTGNCATGHPLTQADADKITTTIFAGEFEGFTYDAATCTMSAIASDEDAGSDAALDANTD